MIEKRYTGIAKQGADVVANPTLDGSEENIESIGINGTNYKVSAKPFMRYFGKEITETFKIDENIVNYENNLFEFYFSVVADSLLPIEIYNKTKDLYFQIRCQGDGHINLYNIDFSLPINDELYGCFIGGDDQEDQKNYIMIRINNGYFGENDEIEIKYYAGYGTKLYEY